MSDDIRLPQIAKATPGKIVRLKATTKESTSDRAMLNVRLAMPRKQMVVDGQIFGNPVHTTVVSQFQMGLN